MVHTAQFSADRWGRYFYASSHCSWDQLQIPDRTVTITVLRDPVERVISLYRYLSDERADEGSAFPADVKEREVAKAGFRSFVDELPRQELLNQLWMFSSVEAEDRLRSLSAVLTLPNLNVDFTATGGRLGLALALRQER